MIVVGSTRRRPRVRGLVVMIVACQVMDPGSIPGERTFVLHIFEVEDSKSVVTSEGIEPPIFGSGIRRVAIAP